MAQPRRSKAGKGKEENRGLLVSFAIRRESQLRIPEQSLEFNSIVSTPLKKLAQLGQNDTKQKSEKDGEMGIAETGRMTKLRNQGNKGHHPNVMPQCENSHARELTRAYEGQFHDSDFRSSSNDAASDTWTRK